MRILPLMLGLAACSAPEEETGSFQTQPPLPPTVPDPWIRDGEVGQLALIRQHPTVTSTRTLRVAAIFGESLDGLRWPALCAFGDRLCLSEAPAPPDEAPVAIHDNALDPGQRTSWLGDTITVGDLPVRFDVDMTHEIGGYGGADRVDGLLWPTYGVSFAGGEWGDFAAEDVLPLPEELEVFEPSPTLPVELDGRTFEQFRWSPTGEGQMVVTVRGDTWEVARLLEDDGEVLVDFGDLRFRDPLDVRLFRVQTVDTLDVGGNTLDLQVVSEQGFCVYDTCDGEPIGGITTPLVFEFCWSTTSCGDSRWTLFPDGTWTTREGYTGTWEYDCCSRVLDILFTSGTRYFGTVDDEGCVDGEMESWSGNLGTWTGCL